MLRRKWPTEKQNELKSTMAFEKIVWFGLFVS